MYYLFIGNSLKHFVMSQQLGRTKDGYVVHDQNEKTSYPQTISLILGAVNTENQGVLLQEVVLDTDVGMANCIPTDESDSIFYAKYLHENRWGRFVRNKQPVPTKIARIVLKKSENNQYQLLAFQLGPAILTEPDDTEALQAETDPVRAFQKSVAFWQHHAWVEGSIAIDPLTITHTNPW